MKYPKSKELGCLIADLCKAANNALPGLARDCRDRGRHLQLKNALHRLNALEGESNGNASD